jgi:ubiquinone/menaquinone biosynthesis C-methylase UbiE
LPHTGGVIKVADIMSGSGKFGSTIEDALRKKGFEVDMTYMDASEVILSSIGDAAKTQVINVVDMKEIPESTFDMVVCRYGFNNLPKEKWEEALNEVLRIIKPEGLFLLQDHFVPGEVFSELVNEAEQYLARMEKKTNIPYIFSTEEFNSVLDKHPLVKSRIKAGYGFYINIWERLKAKKEILPDFEAAKNSILDFYKTVCLEKYKLLIVNPEEYIHVYNITYAIVKR